MKPVRWYELLSTWIFLLSAMYPILHFPTFPLNVLALVGCVECFFSKEHYLKNIYIVFIHLAPFFWIPYDISVNALLFAAFVISTYLMFIFFIVKDSPIDIYRRLLKENHTRFSEFLSDRFFIGQKN